MLLRSCYSYFSLKSSPHQISRKVSPSLYSFSPSLQILLNLLGLVIPGWGLCSRHFPRTETPSPSGHPAVWTPCCHVVPLSTADHRPLILVVWTLKAQPGALSATRNHTLVPSHVHTPGHQLHRVSIGCHPPLEDLKCVTAPSQGPHVTEKAAFCFQRGFITPEN